MHTGCTLNATAEVIPGVFFQRRIIQITSSDGHKNFEKFLFKCFCSFKSEYMFDNLKTGL